jgi:peptidyl-prolyl cis-trans isomerase B (cyclophilin B)
MPTTHNLPTTQGRVGVAGSSDRDTKKSRTATRLAEQRAAAQAKARRRITIAAAAAAVIVIVVIVVAVTLGGKQSSNSTATNTAASLVGTGTKACTYTPAGNAAKKVGDPPPKGVAAKTYKATIATNQGQIVVNLDGAKAPCTVNSFIYLASKGYFDGTSCHRLTTSGIYVLQCGDPTATGAGGPGYEFGDENLSGATYPAGTVAMANAGPNTNGSQFFLVYKDTQLSPNYTPFGTIVSGLDVLNKVAAKGSDNSNNPGEGKPNSPVKISQVTVTG